MVSHIVIFVLSLAVLVKSADWIVEFGARIAKRFGVSDLVIGLTLTSVGTSVPELASSVSAAVQGNSGLIIGAVVGSNIANIGLIAGVAALVHPFATEAKMYDRDGFILLAGSAAFFGAILDNSISSLEAAGMLALYVAYVVFVARSDREKLDYQFRYFLEFFTSLEYVRPLVYRLRHPGRRKSRREEHNIEESDGEERDGEESIAQAPADAGFRHTVAFELIMVAVACVGVVFGASYLVVEASWAAAQLGVPESIVGLSLIAIGTSLPELSVAISAARKGNAQMVIGNVMGSNLANTLLILGTAGLIGPIEVAEISVVFTVPIMLFFTLGLLHIVKSGWRVTRFQGGLIVVAYVAFLTVAFLQGGG